MKMKLAFTLVLSFASFLTIKAQSKEEKEYRIESEKIRKAVWAWTDPKFNVREIPAAYEKASKVIIAHHVELNAAGTARTASILLSFSSKQNFSEIVRQVIKLNDKNAVSAYSELSFSKFLKSSGFTGEEISNTMIGIRVIKPDGSIREINADDVVLTQNSKTSKQAKLAVPDLQPGDIIDYYVATIAKITDGYSEREYLIKLFDDTPVLNYSFHGEVGSKYWMKYRSFNGAPKLKVSSSANKDMVIDVSNKNIPAFETDLWLSAERQLPFIRIKMGILALKNDKIGEVVEYSGNDIAISDLGNSLEGQGRSFKSDPYVVNSNKRSGSWGKSTAKRIGQDYKTMSIEEQAAMDYYSLRFYSLMPLGYGDYLALLLEKPRKVFNRDAFDLYKYFDAAGLNSLIIGSESRTGYRFADAISSEDLYTVVYIPEINKYFQMNTIFDLPFQIPVEMEGVTETRLFDFSKYNGETKGPIVPKSKSTDNARLEKYTIALIPAQNALQAKRNTTLKGYYKLDIQRQLVLYEDYYEQERLAMGEKLTIIEELEKWKIGKKYAEELRNAYADARKKQKEDFLQDAKEWLGQDIADIKETTILNMGARHTSPDFVYSSSFTINGMVKKAGNNFIIEIGKILGEPLKVNEEQRNRNLDIYMPFARSIEYEVTLDIPEGYSAEGINALNANVKNETGFFTAEATASEKQVILKIKKHYLNNFEPASNFGKLTEFMDASSAWTDSKLLLRKK